MKNQQVVATRKFHYSHTNHAAIPYTSCLHTYTYMESNNMASVTDVMATGVIATIAEINAAHESQCLVYDYNLLVMCPLVHATRYVLWMSEHLQQQTTGEKKIHHY